MSGFETKTFPFTTVYESAPPKWPEQDRIFRLPGKLAKEDDPYTEVVARGLFIFGCLFILNVYFIFQLGNLFIKQPFLAYGLTGGMIILTVLLLLGYSNFYRRQLRENLTKSFYDFYPEGLHAKIYSIGIFRGIPNEYRLYYENIRHLSIEDEERMELRFGSGTYRVPRSLTIVAEPDSIESVFEQMVKLVERSQKTFFFSSRRVEQTLKHSLEIPHEEYLPWMFVSEEPIQLTSEGYLWLTGYLKNQPIFQIEKVRHRGELRELRVYQGKGRKPEEEMLIWRLRHAALINTTHDQPTISMASLLIPNGFELGHCRWVRASMAMHDKTTLDFGTPALIELYRDTHFTSKQGRLEINREVVAKLKTDSRGTTFTSTKPLPFSISLSAILCFLPHWVAKPRW
ncbi:Hypothetical protein PBC10988_38460 [Planctomycetales bacterium 10988]|nr:Hypothetical protein PBC10988_38460 [Planctomycetales bacterium 10988]